MNEDALSQLYLKDTAFQDLMQKRIFNVLLVASPYDAFMMVDRSPRRIPRALQRLAKDG